MPEETQDRWCAWCRQACEEEPLYMRIWDAWFCCLEHYEQAINDKDEDDDGWDYRRTHSKEKMRKNRSGRKGRVFVSLRTAC